MRRQKMILVIILLGSLLMASCGQDYLEERHEHGNVTCVYKIERNFIGTTTAEKEIACR